MATRKDLLLFDMDFLPPEGEDTNGQTWLKMFTNSCGCSLDYFSPFYLEFSFWVFNFFVTTFADIAWIGLILPCDAMRRGVCGEPMPHGLLSSVFGHTIWPIAGGWIGECQGVSTCRWAMTTAPLGLQPAPRSPTDSAWHRKVSSFYEPPRRGTVGVLMKERLHTDRGRLMHICSPFALGLASGRSWKWGGIYTTLHYCTWRVTPPCGYTTWPTVILIYLYQGQEGHRICLLKISNLAKPRL
jgi:hypothetical protein